MGRLLPLMFLTTIMMVGKKIMKAARTGAERRRGCLALPTWFRTSSIGAAGEGTQSTGEKEQDGQARACVCGGDPLEEEAGCSRQSLKIIAEAPKAVARLLPKRPPHSSPSSGCEGVEGGCSPAFAPS